MSSFREAFEKTMEWEGGYSNDSHDSGGKTKYGVSQKSYPGLVIADLTIDQAKNIFYNDYWIKAHCDEVEAICGIEIAMVYFDCAVNCGLSSAGRILQRTIETDVDGIVGPNTLSALSKASFSSSRKQILFTFVSYRLQHYMDIVRRKPSQVKYLYGWLSRTMDFL